MDVLIILVPGWKNLVKLALFQANLQKHFWGLLRPISKN